MKRSQSAFTLVELLIVLSLQMLLIGLAMMSVQTLSKQWTKEAGRQMNSIHTFKNVDTFSAALKATTPYLVFDNAGSQGFYFLGREDGFTAITLNGVYNAGGLAVYRVLKERQSDGLYSLYYEEAPLTTYTLVSANQEHNFNFRMKLFENLEQLSFRYRGWSSFAAFLAYQNEHATEKDIKWHISFDGLITKLHPELIEIVIDKKSWFISPLNRDEFLKSRRTNTSDL